MVSLYKPSKPCSSQMYCLAAVQTSISKYCYYYIWNADNTDSVDMVVMLFVILSCLGFWEVLVSPVTVSILPKCAQVEVKCKTPKHWPLILSHKVWDWKQTLLRCEVVWKSSTASQKESFRYYEHYGLSGAAHFCCLLTCYLCYMGFGAGFSWKVKQQQRKSQFEDVHWQYMEMLALITALKDVHMGFTECL